MSKRAERIFSFLVDFLTANAAYYAYYLLRVRSGWVDYPIEPELWLPMIAVYVYWLMWFGFFGLYQSWYAKSRLDEVITIFRTTGVGVLFLFFIIFIDDSSTGSQQTNRLIIAAYWLTLFIFVSAGRLVIRAMQRRLLESGIGARNTLIIGWSKKAFELCDMVLKSPALGYKLIGFVSVSKGKTKSGKKQEYQSIRVLGALEKLPTLMRQRNVREVLIGLDSTEHDKLLEVIRACDGEEVGMKIIPDLYDIVSGQARMSSIYGVPLIEVSPELLKPWEAALKRAFDIAVSLLILVLGFPLWILVALLIKLDTRGPVFYKQERVGRNSKSFFIYKFRSMTSDAEKQSGPVWAGKNDPRVTRVGRLIRKTHIDEMPQFINVLKGDMSVVGPRPERPFFVEKLTKELPLYKRRLKVRPGITGWAQVKLKYDESIEDVRVKVKYDLFYIENLSWRLDLKILFNTMYVMLRGKGHA
ncbi:MAG: sugar transferase [Ignavibacteriae bacterium]|nr:sugar transferase [Ignavibacteriota bacterium]